MRRVEMSEISLTEIKGVVNGLNQLNGEISDLSS